MADFTKKFMDKVSEINNLGKERGFRNGLDMAKAANKQCVLLSSEFADYKNAHNLRNAIAHGRAKDVSISGPTYNFVCNIFIKLRNSNLRGKKTNKVNKKTPSGHSHEKPRLPGGMKDNPDNTIRFFGNSLKITVANCTKSLTGHKLTLVFESSIDQRITLNVYKPLSDYDEMIEEEWLDCQRGVKQRYIVRIKGAFTKEVLIDITPRSGQHTGMGSFVYSLKHKKIE